MATAAEVKQANLESAILFMQQGHANTLKDLHNEIQNLQKKCSELTFELAMQSTTVSDEDEYKKKYEDLEKLSNMLQEKSRKQAQQLEKKDNTITFLEDQLKSLSKQYNDDLTKQHQKVKTLTLDLDNKADTIVNLSDQIRIFRHKVPLQRQHTTEFSEARLISPSPPKEGTPRFRRQITAHSFTRPASGRKLPTTPSGTSSSVPDHHTFISTQEINNGAAVIVEVKPTPAVLPPIRQGSDDSTINRAFVRARLSQQRKSSQAEIVTLAVDQLPNSHQRKCAPAESESHEY